MLQQNATGYPIPIFLSETGCIMPPPRTFDDQSAIFGSEMDGTWSGAIVYEWIEETNNYGLISYGPPAAPKATGAGVVAGYTRTGSPTPISPDFDNLSSQWATLSPSGVAVNAYKPTETPPPCPAYTSGMWEVSGNVPLPTLGQKGYTTAAAAASGTKSAGGSSTTTKASSAASATRASSVALRRRDMMGTWAKVLHWAENHAAIWFLVQNIAIVLSAAIVVSIM